MARSGKYRLGKYAKNQRMVATGKVLDRAKIVRLGCLNSDGWNEQKEFDVQAAIEAKNLDVYTVVETHFMKGERKKINIPGFEVFECRRDKARHDKKGGGVACLVRKSMGVSFTRYNPVISKPELSYVDSERLWVTYNSQHGRTAVGSIYLGWNADDGRHEAWNRGIYEVLSEEVRGLRSQGFRVVLQGDFNGHVGNVLERGGIPGNRPEVNKNGEMFLSFLMENNLCHLNGAVRVQGDWKSRICQGLWTWHARDYSNSTILDYIVVSSEHLGSVQDMQVDEGAIYGGASDHNMLFARLTDKFVSVRPKASRMKKASWSIDENTDFSKFRRIVQQQIESLPSVGQGVDELSDSLTKALLKGLDEGVGRIVPLPARATLYPRHIVQLLKERKLLERDVKTLKCQFASSRLQVPPPSLMVARRSLDAKTDELEMAKSKFASQRRGPLLNLARTKGRKPRGNIGVL